MTRLRLAPSSPERLAELLPRIESYACWLTMCPDSPVDCHRTAQELTLRGWRLLLMWFENSISAHTWAAAKVSTRGRLSTEHYYRLAWSTYYPHQHWPPDGDERLRRELDE